MENRLKYPVFDPDNHMYEKADAFTRYLPDECRRVIRTADVDGCERILSKAIGPDEIVFGSDYPHPEGLADPVSYVRELGSPPAEDVKRIIGSSLADALKVA